MKNLLIPICLLFLPILAFSQNRALNKFYRQYKRGDAVQNMKLPGWLIRFGGKIAVKSSDMDQAEEEMVKELIKKAGTVRFMYSEDGLEIPAHAINDLKNDLYKDDFDDMIMIRSGNMNFELMLQESDGIVKNIFMLYNDRDEGEMAFVSMKLKINLDEVTKLVEQEMEKNYHDIIEPEETPSVEPIL